MATVTKIWMAHVVTILILSVWDRDGDIIQDGEIPMHFSRLSSYPGFLSRIFPPALC